MKCDSDSGNNQCQWEIMSKRRKRNEERKCQSDQSQCLKEYVSFATLYVWWDGWCRYYPPLKNCLSLSEWQSLRQQDLTYKHVSGISADSPDCVSICSIALHLTFCSSIDPLTYSLSISLFSHLSPPHLVPHLTVAVSHFALLSFLSLSPPLLFCVSHFLSSPSIFPPVPSSLSDWLVIHSSSQALIHISLMIHPECSLSLSPSFLFSYSIPVSFQRMLITHMWAELLIIPPPPSSSSPSTYILSYLVVNIKVVK